MYIVKTAEACLCRSRYYLIMMMDHDGHIEKFHTTRFFSKGKKISKEFFFVPDSSKKRMKNEKVDLRTRTLRSLLSEKAELTKQALIKQSKIKIFQ